MAEHEPSIGLSSDWFTPKPIFDALGLVFDLYQFPLIRTGAPIGAVQWT